MLTTASRMDVYHSTKVQRSVIVACGCILGRWCKRLFCQVGKLRMPNSRAGFAV